MVFYFSWGALGSGAKVQFSELVMEFGFSPLHTLLFHLNLTDIFPPPERQRERDFSAFAER
jgi:hypothetical protein